MKKKRNTSGTQSWFIENNIVVFLFSYITNYVLNLFDQDDDPALSGEFDELPMATTDGRCRSLAEVIRRVDADVLALQEGESEAAVLELI